MTARWLPGTLESDLKKINPAIQQIGNDTDTILGAYVTTIAGNTGAFTLNATSGITNATNDIKLSQATSSQFGAVKVDGTSIKATAGVISSNGGWVLLNTLTASNSATLSDTTSLTSTYAEYEIIFTNILAGTAGGQQLELQVHSGAAFQATSYLSNSLHSGSAGTSVTNPTTFIPLTGAGVVLTTGAGYSGSIRVQSPSQTSSPKNWFSIGSVPGSVGFIEIGGGSWNGGNGAIDGFQVLMGTGNIASGTVKIYGRL